MKNGITFLLLLSLIGLRMASAREHIDLDHTKWKLISVGGKTLNADRSFTLSFEKDLLVVNGCNVLSGRFQLDGQSLVLAGPLRSTLRACTGDTEDLDQSFEHLLRGRPALQTERDQITLAHAGYPNWVFRKEALPSKDAKIRFIYVGPFTKDCTGVAPMKCLEVRDSKDAPWRLHYTGIVGFEHVPGIEYRLRIKEDRIANPPADSSSLVWYLDAVIEQSVVDRKAADDYLASKRR